MLVVPDGDRSYQVDAAIRPEARDAAAELGAMLRTFDIAAEIGGSGGVSTATLPASTDSRSRSSAAFPPHTGRPERGP